MQVTPARVLLGFASVALVAAGCDFGHAHREDDVGPPMNVRAVTPVAGATVPADGTITIELDRLLDPDSVAVESLDVVGADGRSIDAKRAYDPVRRTVRLFGAAGEGKAWLPQGQKVRVLLDRASHLEAIDHAHLADNAQRELAFDVAAPAGNTQPPAISFCTDVLPVLQAKCAGSTCHSAPTAPLAGDKSQKGVPNPAGLVLDSPAGIANTAVSRVANSSNTGDRAGIARARGGAFGIDMAIVEPGRPDRSWLLYKTLLSGAAKSPSAIPRPSSCSGTPRSATALAALGTALDDAERTRLSQFVTGQAMPYPTFDQAGNPVFDTVDMADLDRIRAWIEQGAIVRDCTACEP